MNFLLIGILFTSAFAAGQLQTGTTAQPTPTPNPQVEQPELNTELMKVTFKLMSVPPAPTSLGTGFILGRRFPQNPERSRYVLVTAAHVLQSMVGDTMLIIMRRRSSTTWEEVPVLIPIRSRGAPLWTQHPRADVAAMYVNLPEGLGPTSLFPSEILAEDRTLTKYEIHPGDELNVLGYPLGFSYFGFPVLRSGKIASYPLVPTRDNQYFLLDFRVFKGNSGGPVYMVENFRYFGGALKGGTMEFIAGLVSSEEIATEQSQSLYENQLHTYPLGLARIVPATYISETINMLPPPAE